jgi:hypothetical protein
MNEPEQEQIEDSKEPATGWIQVPVMRGIFEIEPLLELCDKHGGRIIGGYARYCCSTREQPVKAGDVDIFPVGATEEESQKVYEGIKAALETAGLKVKHENNVSLTYEAATTAPYNRCPTIQMIKPVREGAVLTWGTVEEILDSFDFTIVRVSLNPDRKTATAWASFPDDEQHKKLRILNIHCPISSLLRIMKYGRKGYYMRPVEALKLFQDWETRTPEYRQRMAELFQTGQHGKLTQKEIDELEALLRID